MSQCAHLNFEANVEVARIPDEKAFFAELQIKCADCGLPFHFVGVKSGCSPYEPMRSITGTELRAPIAPGELEPAKSSTFVMWRGEVVEMVEVEEFPESL